ncbi:Mitochondrial ornithine transporter 1 [Nakaseomyces bracarensis]|uniref:Mitochondrial ornithine transporter 1 n=1 Tax=Nakaseomyces bracarensis TaxID=273131 RepID=A0ABR4NUH1_9SACH
MESSEDSKWLESAAKDILFGSIAGAIGKVIEYPFDTIKVRLQTQGKDMFPTTLSCIKYTYQHEGVVKGFFQGIGSPLAGAALENAALFVSYNQCSKLLNHYTNISELNNILISGAFAGSCASFVLTPVELVKCKLQVANLQALTMGTTGGNIITERHTRIVPTIQSIIRNRGFSGLWQGQSSTFIRESFGGVAWFATYELMKKYLLSRHTTENNLQPNESKTWELLASGASAGLAFNASIFPADTVKSLMQTEHVGLKSAVVKIMKEKGIRGFYRGLGITLIRAIPANATVFYVYETLSHL